MPRVPVLNTDVRSTPMRAVRESAEAPIQAFGGQGMDAVNAQTAAIGGIADSISGVIQREREKADDAWSKEMYSKVNRRKNELMYGAMGEDGAPTPGLLSKRGKAAFNVSDEGLSSFQKLQEEFDKEATSDEQRMMLREIFRRESDDMHSVLSRHSSAEIQNYRKQATEAAVESATNDAVMRAGAPDMRLKVAESLKLQEGAIREYLAGQVDEDQMKLAVGAARGKTYEAIIDRMVSLGDDLGASKYFEEVRDQIGDKDSLLKIEDRLQKGSVRGESRRVVDDILRTAKDEKQAYDMLKKRGIENTQVFDAARDRLKDEYTMMSAAKRQRNEEITNKFYNQIEETRSLKGIQDSKEWDELEPSQKNGLLAKYKSTIEGIEVPDSPQALNELYSLMSTNDRELKDKYLKMNLMTEYAGQLSSKTLKEMVKLQAGVRVRDGQAMEKLDGILTDTQIIEDAMLNVMKVNPKHKGNADKVSEFRDAVSRQVAVQSRSLGRPLKDEEKVSIAQGLAVKLITEKGMLFNTYKFGYQLQPNQGYELTADAIPAIELSKIRAQLKKDGHPETPENMVMMYQLKLNKILSPTQGTK